MARPTNKDQALKGQVEKLREKTIEKFFGLSDKMLKHIEESMSATKPCVSCAKDPKTGAHLPGKSIDSSGLCAQCHGTYLVPDNPQRNWATEQAQPIIAPAPKTIEMNVEQKSITPELEDAARKLDDESLKQRLAVLELMDSPNVGTQGK